MLKVYLTRFSAFVSNELCRQEDPEKIMGNRWKSDVGHLVIFLAVLPHYKMLHSSITGVRHAASTWGPSDLNMRAAERHRWLLAQVLAVLLVGTYGDITVLWVKSEIGFMSLSSFVLNCSPFIVICTFCLAFIMFGHLCEEVCSVKCRM